MRVDLFGLTMDAPEVTFYLWSPWRCSFLEHKLFDSLKSVPNAKLEPGQDELRLTVADQKGWKAAVQNLFNSTWREAQFGNSSCTRAESAVPDPTAPCSASNPMRTGIADVHFTSGVPFNLQFTAKAYF